MTDPVPGDDVRAHAIKRLLRRRDLVRNLVLFVLVNAFLVVVWANTGDGFFWPIFPIVGWGIAVVLNAWDVDQPEGPDEEQISREMDRIRREEQPPPGGTS